MPTPELKPQRMITIRDLPAEIISQIVQEVDHLVSEGRNLKECPRHRPLGLPPDDDDGERCSRWAMRDSRRNDSSAAAGEGDERIYPDKRPTDPLLPLLFISRPFLYAARKLLYRRVHVSGPYQAHLLPRSLADDQLASCVRTLSLFLVVSSPVTSPRVVMHSKPFLAALSHLPRLRYLDIEAPYLPDKRCSITTARILAIQRTSPELEELTVHGLERAGVVNESEEAAMWEEANAEADETDGGGGGKSERRGLKTLILPDEPNIPPAELDLILRNSQQTLSKLHFRNADFASFTRFSLASTLLTYGANLTELVFVHAYDWDYRSKRHHELPFPLRPKDYQNGKPQDEHLNQFAKYPYILDAVLPYLPKLKVLKFAGAHASTNVFSYFPASLKTLSWSLCPAIEPAALGRLLCKPVARTQADGAEVRQEYPTVVAEGLTCITVDFDDGDWTAEEIGILDSAMRERDICFHLSSEGWTIGGGPHGRFRAG
ncbi:hypothetical protein JCM5296_003381 [Sporobolomyces johnsonii]